MMKTVNYWNNPDLEKKIDEYFAQIEKLKLRYVDDYKLRKTTAIYESILNMTNLSIEMAHLIAKPPKRILRPKNRTPLKKKKKQWAIVKNKIMMQGAYLQHLMITSQPIPKFPVGGMSARINDGCANVSETGVKIINPLVFVSAERNVPIYRKHSQYGNYPYPDNGRPLS